MIGKPQQIDKSEDGEDLLRPDYSWASVAAVATGPRPEGR